MVETDPKTRTHNEPGPRPATCIRLFFGSSPQQDAEEWAEYMSNLASRASGSRKISALAQSCATVRHRWANGQRLAAQETAEPILHEIRMRSQGVLERLKPVSGLQSRHVDSQVEKEFDEVSS